MNKIFLTFLSCLICNIAWAAPVLDEGVKKFLAQPGARVNDQLEVLVTYKNQATRVANSSRESLERALRAATKQQEIAVLQKELGIKKANKESLWIVNGTQILLTRVQLQRAVVSDNLAQIQVLNRPVFLIEGVKSTVAQKALDFTYGLVKLNIPTLQKDSPTFDGRGVLVGIIDTGIDESHPDLKGKVAAFKNFDEGTKQQTPFDDHGHGSHVAGTIAGGANSGTRIGVATGAKLVVAKAFGQYGDSSEKSLLGSLQWIVDPDGDPKTDDHPQVISNSWGLGENVSNRKPEDEIFCKALQTANDLGIVVVFSAGNDGPRRETIGLPGACPQAVAVGATDQNDRIASFSSRGPVKWKNMTLTKPDISAPGVEIYSVAAGGGYTEMDGTSMAAPHIAGLAAVLFSASPKSSAESIRQAMTDGAFDLGDKDTDIMFGAGRADALKSIQSLPR